MDNGLPGVGLWDPPQTLLFTGLRHCPLPTPTALPPPSASRGCTQVCLHELVITTLRKPDQPIVMRVGLP